MELSPANEALVARLKKTMAISPQLADLLREKWAQSNLLLDAARGEGAQEHRREWKLVPTDLLVEIATRLPPAPMTAADGKTYAFHDPKAAERLLEIRALFDRLLIASSEAAARPDDSPDDNPAKA